MLALLLGTQFMLAADFSIFNVALPAVGRGVGLALDTLQWVATAYALPAAGFTLRFGRVADLAGRRRMLLIGLGLLAAASVYGGTAHTPVALLSARVVQGLSTAIAAPAALSLITTTFPEGPLRARALGFNGAITAAGFTCGALLGGMLTGLWSWRWAFLVNVPVALVIVAAVPRLIPEGRDGRTARLDLPGAITVSLGLLALIWGVTTGGVARWAFVPAAGLLIQGNAWWVAAALAACYFGNMVAVVAYVVTVTSGLPDHEQGLATGLSAMAQQVGTTVGIPLLSTIATAPGGIHSAVGVNAAITMAVALLVRLLGRVPAAG
ncbi:MFS transporter [Actinoallomurus iriomotensis]|uniref:Major facilitator superfamily (MFS) profile domain-containing protein n=1 Tax=Actinoallomurus iriomotensis TaxID=478107 RepID=A0A9W6VM38_9ACTN|nr:MFS transporter [Actinoallomurus iriomotensis]GLY72082.1 hypothetical protein Airi01_003490 [Actinoallomurus iriomotensis]